MTELTRYNEDMKNKHDDAADVTALASWYLSNKKFMK